ncbi:DNA-dependent metalloprotease SPRTN isoform X1 [Saimiri boliviensis]|uniref:DNA-dependent metalloprotease SPRTN n=1 Tax=Saimiri boliviensis boliviensis TaxID=39432 RepID=A0A2K6SFE5_SAIBB|nr:DNA-dependent metalloprotease SPRTN isoform X1 [Saimiri boliviensis boliviensis]
MDDDLMLALRLQEEWNLQVTEHDQAQEPLSLVDASWELVDPTPDLQALFVQFNDQFFWGQLGAVEVKWSVRMTLCAGICSYEGKGGMCSIRLSEPLLKLRPRKDLVETLLHEMIHAYLFVTNNDKDREGHGPEFCKHMHRINRMTGANITVYHTFHDEVDEYRRHWWRCNGPCQHRPPYYGYVKRATNREPSAHDYWWAEHQKTCGGTFIKIKEPENYSKKGKGKTKLGQHPVSATETKDKPNRGEAQLVIPFSGKGYVLGETSILPSPGKLITSHAVNKTQNLLNHNHSANAVRSNSKIKVNFEQNVSSKKNSHLVFPALNSHQNVLSNYFPRLSVASQKAFRGVNGSPTKNVTVGNIPKNSVSSGSQRRVSSSKISLRNSSKAMESTSVTLSQDVNGSEGTFPNKRPRLEDKTVFDNFFIKKEQIESRSNDPKYSSCPTAIQNSSSSSSQSKRVNCPVCQNEVLESQINEHLDWCLEGDCVKVKS